jgi:beta-glucosidase
MQTAQQGAKAVLESWYGGQAAGTAIARTLTGRNNPAGRLPVTFYQSVDQLPPFDDYSMNGRTYRYFKGKPLYPFGYGLSYSNFTYADLQVHPSGDAEREISAHLTNDSKRDGDEVTQLYIGKGDSNPVLKGFHRVHLRAGESAVVRFIVNTSGLQDARTVSIGGGQPIAGETGNRFVQTELTAHQ